MAGAAAWCTRPRSGWRKGRTRAGRGEEEQAARQLAASTSAGVREWRAEGAEMREGGREAGREGERAKPSAKPKRSQRCRLARGRVRSLSADWCVADWREQTYAQHDHATQAQPMPQPKRSQQRGTRGRSGLRGQRGAGAWQVGDSQPGGSAAAGDEQ